MADEYYKKSTNNPLRNNGTTDSDKVQADRDLWETIQSLGGAVDELSLKPVVPDLPSLSKNGSVSYLLQITKSGTIVTRSWTEHAIPYPPTEAGNYTLKVTVDGEAVTYSWEADEDGR